MPGCNHYEGEFPIVERAAFKENHFVTNLVKNKGQNICKEKYSDTNFVIHLSYMIMLSFFLSCIALF
jgi:hypothetical protein